MGVIGEGIARILVLGFGVSALLVPVDGLLMSLPLLRRRPLRPVGLLLAIDVLLLIVLSSLVQVLCGDARAFGAMPIAGNVGWLFGETLRTLFSTVGSLLVCVTLGVALLIGRSSLSFIDVLERTRRHLVLLARLLLQMSAWCVNVMRSRFAIREHRPSSAPPGPLAVGWDDETPTHAAEVEQLAQENSRLPPMAVLPALRQGMAESTTALLDTMGGEPARIVIHGSSEVASGRDPRRLPEPARSDPPSVDAPVELADLVARGDSVREAEVEADPAPTGEEPVIVERGLDARPCPRGRRERQRVEFHLPSTELLEQPTGDEPKVDRDRILVHAERLEKTLLDYGVTGTVEEIHPGPTVTTYELVPQAGTKVSKVASLSDDLALGLSRKVRIIAPIPGKSRIGFELPNDHRIPVNLRELVEDERFSALSARVPLPVVLGRDIVGAPTYADLANMPHVIVAGATGAGKSVGLNVMLASLLFQRSPEELRLLMIDPKVVELAPFDGIPHLLLPVVTDMKQANVALKWAVDEMERRYQLFATAGTKNIGTYNQWVDRIAKGELPAPSRETVEALTHDGAVVSMPSAEQGADGVMLPGRLPYIVIVIDEFADLMMQQGKEVEASVARLAQKARAAGLHVVLATQRPSVDVITGMIKANFPSRIAFLVAQKVDSRTILDEQGAEMLLGRGDMLVKLNGASELRRVQCPFVSEDEVSRLTDYLRSQGKPQYHEAILQAGGQDEAANDENLDPRFDEAVQIVAETQRCSTSWLQRKMTIGYNRAAKIVEAMEQRGIVGPPNGAKDREVLISPH
jgi:DNA segregation ATPase FtsK/SpoIIIE-like protein